MNSNHSTSQSLPTSSRTSPSVAARRSTAPRTGQPASSRNFGQSSAGGAVRSSSSVVGGDGRGRHVIDREVNEAEVKERKMRSWGKSYLPDEETVRNDYSTRYVDTGERPQNHIRGADVSERFAEYPKLSRLLDLKHSLTSSSAYSIPPTFINLPRGTSMLALLNSLVERNRFECIVLTPPSTVEYEELAALPMSKLSNSPGFVWLWVGSGQRRDGIGLEKGRELLSLWGYRRCEDIVWLKTNNRDPEADLALGEESSSTFASSVEHCLMGIRGTVRRSTDSWFVHCNVDTDLVVWGGDDQDPLLKPPELQTIVESFCLGTRRLHLYGSPRSLRRGWLTISSDEHVFSSDSDVRPVEREETGWTPFEFDQATYARSFGDGGFVQKLERMVLGESEAKDDARAAPVPILLPFHEELDALRPKSPPLRAGQPSSGGLGRGRGAGLGVTRSAAIVGAASIRSGKGPMGPHGALMGMMNTQGRVRGRGGGGGGPRGGAMFQHPMGAMEGSTMPGAFHPPRFQAAYSTSPPVPHHSAPHHLQPQQHYIPQSATFVNPVYAAQFAQTTGIFHNQTFQQPHYQQQLHHTYHHHHHHHPQQQAQLQYQYLPQPHREGVVYPIGGPTQGQTHEVQQGGWNGMGM